MSSNTQFSYHGITKVGEGSEKREEDIVLKVPYDKVLEWLLTRNVISQKGWALQLSQCRKEASKLEAGDTDYLSCMNHMNSLLKTQDTSKGLFGGYNDPKLQQCSAVIAAYKKNNGHLADGAQSLLQLVKYEIPNQRRQVEQLQREAASLERLEQVKLSESESLKKQYVRLCQDLGIEGRDVGEELLGLLSGLPEWYGKVSKAIQGNEGLQRAARFYEAFVNMIHQVVGGEGEGGEKKEEGREGGVLAVLRYVLAKGNTTRAAMEMELRPKEEQERRRQQQQGSKKKVENGGEKKGEEESSVSIDWEVSVDQKEAVEEIPVEISWDIGEVDTAGIESIGEEAAAVVGDDWDKESVLSCVDSRNALLDDLEELLSFLEGRLREKMGSSNSADSIQDVLLTSPDCPETVKLSDTSDGLMQMRDSVQSVAQLAKSASFVRLLQIQSSKRYVSRLAASVRKKYELSQLAVEQKFTIEQRRKQILEDVADVQPKIKALEERADALVTFLQKDIGELFKRKIEIQK